MIDDITAEQPGCGERTALAVEVLRACGHLRLKVRGESMLPTLWPREVVEIASCSIDDVRIGEIVLAQRHSRFFLHRLIGRQPNGFVLRGDSMTAPDSPFPDQALLGRLCGHESGARARKKNDGAGSRPLLPLGAGSRILGQLLSNCELARRLALKLHLRAELRRSEIRSVEDAPLNELIAN